MRMYAKLIMTVMMNMLWRWVSVVRTRPDSCLHICIFLFFCTQQWDRAAQLVTGPAVCLQVYAGLMPESQHQTVLPLKLHFQIHGVSVNFLHSFFQVMVLLGLPVLESRRHRFWKWLHYMNNQGQSGASLVFLSGDWNCAHCFVPKILLGVNYK